MSDEPTPDTVRLTPEEQAQRRKRSIAIALTLVGLFALFYLITILKIGPAILNRPL